MGSERPGEMPQQARSFEYFQSLSAEELIALADTLVSGSDATHIDLAIHNLLLNDPDNAGLLDVVPIVRKRLLILNPTEQPGEIVPHSEITIKATIAGLEAVAQAGDSLALHAHEERMVALAKKALE